MDSWLVQIYSFSRRIAVQVVIKRTLVTRDVILSPATGERIRTRALGTQRWQI